jgi:hypothetical protein
VDSGNNVIVAGGSNAGGGVNPCTTIKYSSAGVPVWTNVYTAPGSAGGTGNAVAVDGNDDVVVTGNSLIGVNNDYATIKYSSAGVPLWTNRYNGPGNGADVPLAVAVDSSNDVIVTGYSASSGSSQAYATIKYSSAGVPLWTNRYSGPANGQDEATAVAVDTNNDVIVTGYSYGSVGNADYATIKYSSAGVPLWTNRYNGPASSFDEATAVAVDANNDVIVTGNSAGSGSGADYATIKYSDAGVPLWTNRYNGPGNGGDYAAAVAVDGNNDVIVTGSSVGGGGNANYATIKYSSEGVPLWTNFYNGPANGTDSPCAVKVDGSNNVVVTGFSGPTPSSLPYFADFATIKYSSDGLPIWISRYTAPGSGQNTPYGMALDSSGNVIVTGYSQGIGSGDDFTTIKYISVASPLLTSLLVTNGTFQMEVDDVLQPGTLVIEASTDLAGWAPIFTNTTPTNGLIYTDADATNYPGRFYRAFQFP